MRVFKLNFPSEDEEKAVEFIPGLDELSPNHKEMTKNIINNVIKGKKLTDEMHQFLEAIVPEAPRKERKIPAKKKPPPLTPKKKTEKKEEEVLSTTGCLSPKKTRVSKETRVYKVI